MGRLAQLGRFRPGLGGARPQPAETNATPFKGSLTNCGDECNSVQGVLELLQLSLESSISDICSDTGNVRSDTENAG